VTVKPEFVEYIRTMVRGEHEANDEIEAELDETGWDGFPRFLASVFFLAVDRRFSKDTPPGEIIKFVADLRADASDGGPAIDPIGAENLIRSIVDSDVDYDLSQEMIGRIQAATALKILTEEELTDKQLDDFFSEAVGLASRRS
jgi:3-methyladenine DNA glycosylase/8-oxoguanine DNA glycosylase